MEPLKLAKLIDENQIQSKVKEIGAALSDRFRKDEVVALGVLKGSFMFFSDLIREIDANVICDFCAVSSYNQGMSSSGEVQLTMDCQSSLKDRHILIIEDIVDTGLSMQFLKNHFKTRQPKSITTTCLLLKPDALKVECSMDHVGFEIANDFVVGYGLDYQNRYRNLPYIAQVQSIN